MAKVVIIGASSAGHSTALNLREKDKDCSITLISQEPYQFYDRRRLLDFLSGTLDEKGLFLCGEDFYQQNNISFLKERKVASVNLEKRLLYFKEKGNLGYDFLVIATGREISLPEIPGIKKPGVFTLSALNDFKALSGYFIDDSACVIGSTGRSLNLAQAISAKYKKEVKLLSQRPFDPALIPQGVEVIESSPEELIGEAGVQAVKLSSGKIIAASVAVFTDQAGGNIDFLKDTDIAIENGLILVDELMSTNRKEVFSSGAVSFSRINPEKTKNWDDCLNEGMVLAEVLSKTMKGETCQRY